MLDLALLTAGVAFFAASILYVFACDRLWGGFRDPRLLDRRHCDRPAADLSRLRAAAAGTLL